MKRQIPLLILAVALFTGCAAATGPVYRDVSKSGSLTGRPGTGMVLIYWPPDFFTGDSGYWLFANDVVLPSQLLKGGFYSYEAAPGPLDVAFSMSKGKSTAGGQALSILAPVLTGGYPSYMLFHRRPRLDINVLPEQTHYVRLAKDSGHLPPVLIEVRKEEGEREIQECHWINSPVK
jgi:hypothetical protein